MNACPRLLAASGTGAFGLVAAILLSAAFLVGLTLPVLVRRHPAVSGTVMLDGIDVPAAKVQRIDEVIHDPQIQARGMVVRPLPESLRARLPMVDRPAVSAPAA